MKNPNTFKGYTQEEIDNQFSEARRYIWMVLGPIFIGIFVLIYFQSNSIEHVKEEYLEIRNDSFQGIIIKKYEEADYPRAKRYVLLDNYKQTFVTEVIYDKLNIGDSVSKMAGSDSIIYFTKYNGVLYRDVAKYRRKAFFKILKKKAKN